jgi:hypothetical protein
VSAASGMARRNKLHCAIQCAIRGDDMPFISVTRLRVRSWRFFPAFIVNALLSARQARRSSGNQGVTLLREERNVFWTRTTWDAEASMKDYIVAGRHGKVMRRLLAWCDEAALAHWTQDSAQPPTWPEAHAQLLKVGRTSKVNHPSEAQRRYQFPVPPVSPKGEVRWR